MRWLWLDPRAWCSNELLVELSLHVSFRLFTLFLMTAALLGGHSPSFIYYSLLIRFLTQQSGTGLKAAAEIVS